MVYIIEICAIVVVMGVRELSRELNRGGRGDGFFYID